MVMVHSGDVMPNEGSVAVESYRRQRCEERSARLLLPVAVVMSFLLAGTVVSSALGVSGRPTPRALLEDPELESAVIAFGAMLGSIVIAVLAATRRIRPERSEAMLVVLLVLAAVASGSQLLLTGDGDQVSRLMVVVSASGALVISLRNFLIPVALAWLFWLALQVAGTDYEVPFWTIGLLMATGVGVLFQQLQFAAITSDARADLARDEAQQRVENLAAEREQTLRTISHDVRLPVAGLLGLTELLARQNLDLRTRELVKQVHNAGESMNLLLNNLLDSARSDAGQLVLHPTVGPLDAVIDDVLGMAAPTAARNGLALVGVASVGAPETVEADQTRLRQILLNLVFNAIKVSGRGPVSIVARAAPDGPPGAIQFTVTDSGPGIPPAERERIFQAFHQISGTPQQSGVGLGLSIVQRLSQAMEASVDVTDPPDGGAAFQVLLPQPHAAATPQQPVPSLPANAGAPLVVVEGGGHADRAVRIALQRLGVATTDQCPGTAPAVHLRVASAAVEDAPGPADGHRLVIVGPADGTTGWDSNSVLVPAPWQATDLLAAVGAEQEETAGDAEAPGEEPHLPAGMRLLVADDDPTFRSLLIERLRWAGAQVDGVANGAAAVEQYARDSYDVVLLDVNMPVMDGPEAARVIRSRLADDAGATILAVTADSDFTDDALLAASGFDGAIRKDARTRDIVGAILSQSRVDRDPGPEQAPRVPADPEADATGCDQEVFDQLREDLGDNDVLTEVTEEFLTELPTRVATVMAVGAGGDAAAAASAAHTVKGSALLFGARRLAELCAEIERDPRDEQATAGLPAEADRTAAWLRSQL